MFFVAVGTAYALYIIVSEFVLVHKMKKNANADMNGSD